MTDDRADILIVGAGPAGTRAAEAARKRDGRARIVVLSADLHPFYNRILLSKDFLKRDDLAPERVVIKPRSAWEAQGIELRTGARVAALDPTARTATFTDGGTIVFQRCVLAPGSVPLTLPVPGGGRLLTLRSLDDAIRLRGAAGLAGSGLVVGGGLIGIEVAAALAARGLHVRLLVRESWPLGHVAPEAVGRAVERRLIEAGVEVRLRTVVTAVEAEGGEIRLRTTAGETLSVPLALAGVGVRYATGFVPAGLRGPRGEILADAALETEAQGIYAAGDAAAWDDPVLGVRHTVEHWLHAQHQGRRAGENLSGERATYGRVTSYDTEIGGLPIAAVGAPELALRWVARGDLPEGPGAVLGLDGDRLVGAFVIGRWEEAGLVGPAIEAWGRGGAPPEPLADSRRPLAEFLPG